LIRLKFKQQTKRLIVDLYEKAKMNDTSYEYDEGKMVSYHLKNSKTKKIYVYLIYEINHREKSFKKYQK